MAESDDDGESLSILQSLAAQEDSDTDPCLDQNINSSRNRLAEEIFKEHSAAQKKPPPASRQWSATTSSATAKQKKNQSSIEDFSGLRIGTRLLSSAETGALIGSKKFFRIGDLTPRVVAILQSKQAEVKQLRSSEGQGRRAADATRDSAWITIGVCAKKSKVNLSSKGSKYIIWTVTDLSAGKMTSISVFLYQEALALKVPVGSIVAIVNAKILPSNNGRGSFMLTVNQGSQLKALGKALDFGYCTYSMKGKNCDNFINKGDCTYCDFHAGVMYKQFKSNRMSLNSTSGGVLPKKIGRQAQHLSHGSYDLPAWAKANQSKKSAAKAKTSLSGVQKIKKSMGIDVQPKKARQSAAVSKNSTAIVGKDGKVYSKAKPRKSGAKGNKQSADATKFKRAVSSGIEANGKYAVACGLSTGGKRCAAALGLDLRVTEKDKRDYIQSYDRKTSNGSALPSRSSARPALGGKNLRDLVSNSKKRHRTATLSKNQIIAEALREKGVKIARTDPNSTRLKDLKLNRTQRSQKLVLASRKSKENILLNLSKPVNTKSANFVTFGKESAEEIMKTKSIFESQGAAAQDKVLDDSLGFLEKKEALSDKLATITSIKVTAYKCHTCKFSLENILDSCKRAGHRIEKIKAKKRFFKCSNCGFKLDTIGEKMPKAHCHRNERWLKCSAYSDKTLGQKSAGDSALKLSS